MPTFGARKFQNFGNFSEIFGLSAPLFKFRCGTQCTFPTAFKTLRKAALRRQRDLWTRSGSFARPTFGARKFQNFGKFWQIFGLSAPVFKFRSGTQCTFPTAFKTLRMAALRRQSDLWTRPGSSARLFKFRCPKISKISKIFGNFGLSAPLFNSRCGAQCTFQTAFNTLRKAALRRQRDLWTRPGSSARPTFGARKFQN